MSSSQFKKFIDRNSSGSLPNELPLVHSTRCEFFDAVKDRGKLEPRLCNVFGEQLLYLFYGRPAYRSKSVDVHDVGYCPICFVLDIDPADLNLRRTYPLDSGGVKGKRFDAHIHEDELDELKLPATLISARQHVNALYGKNKHYFTGDFNDRSALNFTVDDIASRYVDLLEDPDVAVADDRRSALEYQTDSDVSINKSVRAVVLPQTLLDDPDIESTILIDWEATPIGYTVYKSTSPSEYVATVRDKVLEYLNSEGLI